MSEGNYRPETVPPPAGDHDRAEAERPAPTPMYKRKINEQVKLLVRLKKDSMVEGEHYGQIRGFRKPSLLQPGAQMIIKAYAARPEFDEVSSHHTDTLIAYRIKCRIVHVDSGTPLSEGMGSCNSKERQYKNQEPWGQDNTLLKMACKRALVAGSINLSAASHVFTQDVEDFPKQAESQPQHRDVSAANGSEGLPLRDGGRFAEAMK